MPVIGKRPASILTAAVLLLVYGGLMLICGFCSSASWFLDLPKDPQVEAIVAQELPANEAISIIQAVSNLIVGPTMILAGLGILQLAPSARILGLAVAIYEICWLIVHSAYTMIFLAPVMERVFAQQVQNQPAMPFDLGQMMKASMWLGVAISILICLAFCVPIIVCLSTRATRAAFAGMHEIEPPPDDRRPYYDDDDNDFKPSSPTPRSPGDTGITEKP